MREIIQKLNNGASLTDGELLCLLSAEGDDLRKLLSAARECADVVYGKKVFARGLIEISSYCENDCLYCGIRKSNKNAERYRLSREEIVSCAEYGYSVGFRTFVLQGGEDSTLTDDFICDVVREIKHRFPDTAVTLSLGEKSRDSYCKMKEAGADRYLLRHETADAEHYGRLHPRSLTLENRMRCLYDLKELGYQTGAGFMVGSPYQTTAHIVRDLRFIEAFKPQMVGIGPFIPHKDTPFRHMPAGSVDLTLKCLAIVRLIHPHVLLPATTALGSLEQGGRERGILAGANVVMPNLSPTEVRQKYSLYNGKQSLGAESVEGLTELKKSLSDIGYELSFDRGDYIG